VAPDGTFSLTMPEGENRLDLRFNSLPVGYVVESVMYGDTNLLKEPMKLSPDNIQEMVIGLRYTRPAPR
jgi:hypothetical protein